MEVRRPDECGKLYEAEPWRGRSGRAEEMSGSEGQFGAETEDLCLVVLLFDEGETEIEGEGGRARARSGDGRRRRVVWLGTWRALAVRAAAHHDDGTRRRRRAMARPPIGALCRADGRGDTHLRGHGFRRE